jgi:adenine phosphoribosyltransferase
VTAGHPATGQAAAASAADPLPRHPDGTVDVRRLLASRIRDVPDFPEPGVLFKDITPLLADPVAFGALIDAVVARVGRGAVAKVAGIEARGFLLAAPVAYQLGVGVVPVRKAGKLPGRTHALRYDLEYGSATIEIPRDALAAGERVMLIDDVLATGGTAAAAAELLARGGGCVVGLTVLLELTALGGRRRLEPALPVHALLPA